MSTNRSHEHAEQTTQSFERIFSSGWTNFKRSSFLSLGATGVMALTLLVFSGLLVLNFFTNETVSYLDAKVDVSVYFKNSAKEDQVLKVKNDLEGVATVAKVNYLSREQALADFKERHKDNQLIQDSIAELEENPLQASLNIKAKTTDGYKGIVDFLEQHNLRDSMEKINFYENQVAIDRIRGLSSNLVLWGLGGSLFLALVAIMVTFNTIRLTIYNKKQEIEIMRLVGASNWHIRGPFMVEGGIYGLFAALLALIIFYPAVYYASGKLAVVAPSLNLFGHFVGNLGWMLLALIGSGLALGVLSSFIAIRRHLKI
ncbi:MAG: hypothetical protein A3F25_00010 [Candidatus Yanofskybacteria bacterium RIFCSPHIGHO2_12_FULL_45_19b]|uniref:Cell division protein FtsX n=2 Tax=Patescibacteria group TaxID=1783273 RepID=A0A1F8G291_9BACT|nr:MAG: hypothetical protein A3F25_00010 [Candidatus Yanofskybacteria bacterium RIFCSPHIGHO2_12_FULL_45_19b]